MDDVTDFPFRELCKSFRAGLLYTEFISAEGINHDAYKSHRKMTFSDNQRPVAVQIFGADESELLRCLESVCEAHPDFVDINWGCPVRKVASRGAGSGMLKDIPKLLKITQSIVQHSPIPVSVKTRLGYDSESICIDYLVKGLQDIGVAMVAIHGRTKTQMYGGKADWDAIGRVKNNPSVTIPILGNGDITEASQVIEVRKKYGIDGVLIGRGAIGNPWIFEQASRLLHGESERPVTVAERVEVCRRHLAKTVDFYGERTALIVMKRHYSAYFKGLYNFRQFKSLLLNAMDIETVMAALDKVRDFYFNFDSTVG